MYMCDTHYGRLLLTCVAGLVCVEGTAHLLVCCVPRAYALNKTTLKTRIKLPAWRITAHNCRVMGSVWVLFLPSAHTKPIYPTHFTVSPYTARITATTTLI